MTSILRENRSDFYRMPPKTIDLLEPDTLLNDKLNQSICHKIILLVKEYKKMNIFDHTTVSNLYIRLFIKTSVYYRIPTFVIPRYFHNP